MKSHAQRLETHVNNALKSGRITQEEHKELSIAAYEIKRLQVDIDAKLRSFWMKLERK